MFGWLRRRWWQDRAARKEALRLAAFPQVGEFVVHEWLNGMFEQKVATDVVIETGMVSLETMPLSLPPERCHGRRWLRFNPACMKRTHRLHPSYEKRVAPLPRSLLDELHRFIEACGGEIETVNLLRAIRESWPEPSRPGVYEEDDR